MLTGYLPDITFPKSTGVKIIAVLKGLCSNKSLSPVTKKSAPEKSIRSNKKLSFGSRFKKCVGVIAIFKAIVSSRSNNSMTLSFGKYFFILSLH